MLKLEKLEISGFKSFADKTVLMFGEGITGVVGPNGCGKSNIAESISWVLGEQSAKNLRGSKMEDVIFNGTRDRKPQGAAEVTLTLLATADIASRDSEEDTGDDESRFDAAIVSAGRAAAAAKSLIEGAEKVEGGDGPPSTVSTTGSAESIGAQSDEEVAATDGAAPEPAETPRRSRKRGRIVVQAGERVTVGRRLYRTGDSDYLMNGRACLLRDIQDLFAGTGLGGAHYAIIEQGRIGQILSSKPLDRRGLIEEAAGITKFKSRKRLAELKLESAKQNLTRLNDIISEIERQVNSLKRQAAKARRYRRLREEMRSLLKLVFAADYYRLTHAAEEIARQLEEASSAVSEAAARVTERETENRAVATEARAAEDHLASLKEQAAAVGLDADRARNRRAFEEQQIKELSARLDENGRIQAGLTERLGLLDAQIEKKGGELGGLKSEVSAEQAELLKKESDYQADVSRVRAAEKHIEGLRQKLFIEVAKAERVTNALASLEDALRRLDLRQTNLNAELERATEKRQEAQAQSTGMQAEVDAGRAELEDLKIRIDDSACVLQSVREETRGLQSRLDAVQTERAGAQHRLTSLEDVDARHAYYSDAVQQVLSPDQSARINAMGTLADFVHVADSRYERLIESLFGRELQSVLVPTIDDALTGVEYIRTEGLGRGAFLVVGLHGAEGEPSDYFLESSPSIEASAPQETNGGYTPSVIIDPGHLLAAASVSGPEGGSSALARPGTGTIPEYTAEPAKTEAASGPAANEDESSDSIPQSASAGPEIDTEAELKNLAKDVVQLYVDYCTDYNSQADTGAEASADASPDLHGSRVTGLVESADDGASTYGELGFAGEDAGVPPGVIFDQASFYSGACEPVREFGASHGDSLPAPATDSDRSQGSPESANDGATAVPLTEAIGQSENDVFASAAVSDRPGSFLVHEGESDSSEAACQAALTPGDHAFSADDDAVAAAGSPPVPALQEPDSMDAAGQPAETASELVELVASPSTPAWMQETSEHSNGSGGSSDGSREAPLPDTLLKDPSPASTARNGNGASMHFELEVLRAVDLMGLRAEIKPVVERAFPDKCGASVVPDVEAALQLSMESGWRTYVTYDGEQVVNGRLIVTSAQAGQQGASLLAIKREIKQLSGMTATLLANETVLAESLAVCRVRLEQEEAAAAALDGELRKAEKMAASRESQLVSLERELERAEQHVRVVAAELDQAAEERAELELKIEELAAEVLRAEGARNLASHSLTAAQADFVTMRQEVEQLADTLSKSRATAAARVERSRAAESEMRRLEGES
ncbi:MAG TPA: AAA family ATPase, partial [Blastocatellia bacterium]|nr:AAA family ATPase [Blastocatellia bacterium]